MSINPINMPTEETLMRIATATEQMARGSVFLPRLSVSSPIGVDITVTDGNTTLQKTSTEITTIFDIPNYGKWTASYTGTDGYYSAYTQVDTVKIYPLLPIWTVPTSFSETSWADIVKAAGLNSIPDSWQLKDTKTLTLTDAKTITIEIAGKNREDIVGGGTASLVLGFADILETHVMNPTATNVGGWGSSNLRTYCNGYLYNKFPSELKSGIKKAIKKTSAGNQLTSIVTTEDYLWAYSATEVFASPSTSYSPGGEGELYSIFTDDASRIKKLDSSASVWWLRSPYTTDAAYFCRVHSDGTIAASAAIAAFGVVLGFAI